MVQLKDNTLTITAECKNPLETLNQLRNALTVVTSVLVTSDEFYNNVDLREAISSLITLQGQLGCSGDKTS